MPQLSKMPRPQAWPLNSALLWRWFYIPPPVAQLPGFLKTGRRSAVRAHLLREKFQRFWQYESPTWAGNFLDSWCTGAMRSQLEPMKQVARSLQRHRTPTRTGMHPQILLRKQKTGPATKPHSSRADPWAAGSQAFVSGRCHRFRRPIFGVLALRNCWLGWLGGRDGCRGFCKGT